MSRRRRRGPASREGFTGLVALLIVVAVVLWLVWDRLPPLSQLPIPKPDTASKPGAPPAPPAAVTDQYEVYFTTPVYPDRPETRRGGIDEKFVAYVDASKKTLDVA